MEESKQNQESAEKNLAPKSGSNKNLIFGLAIIVIFIAVFLGVKNWVAGITSDGSSPTNSTTPNQSETSNSNASTQVNGDPNTGIEVIVNYEKDKSQSAIMFRIGFSTHVVDYSDYNFNENVVLRDSRNKEYKASNITTEGSGHHQAIEATFPLVVSPFKLVVKNLAGAPERIFNF